MSSYELNLTVDYLSEILNDVRKTDFDNRYMWNACIILNNLSWWIFLKKNRVSKWRHGKRYMGERGGAKGMVTN